MQLSRAPFAGRETLSGEHDRLRGALVHRRSRGQVSSWSRSHSHLCSASGWLRSWALLVPSSGTGRITRAALAAFPLRLLATVLYISGGVVLPAAGLPATEGLLDDFERRGRTSILFLIAYLIGWIPINVWEDGTWVTPGLFVNLLCAVLLAAAYWAKRVHVRRRVVRVNGTTGSSKSWQSRQVRSRPHRSDDPDGQGRMSDATGFA